MPAEKNFENKIKRLFKKKDLYYFKFWGTMYTRSGVPDLIVCVNGRFLGVEVKADEGKPSEIQLENIRQIRENTGCTGKENIYSALYIHGNSKRRSEKKG